MHYKRWMVLAALLLFALLSFGCGGGGGSDEVTITSINTNPSTVTAGSVIALTASISAPGQSIASLVKNWTVSTGSLTSDPPEFSLLLRETAKEGSATSLSTTSNTVYWVAPAEMETATITLAIDGQTKTLTVAIGESPITLSVTNGVCTVATNNITDLYQAAFRINYTSAWTPSSIEAGDFLGETEGDDREAIYIGMTNQDGFVPFAISRLGDADGVDGSGTLATVTFSKTSSTASTREVADVPFEFGMVLLYDSSLNEIDAF